MTCLMTLACVTGIGAAVSHAEPMGAMHQLADAQQSGHDSAGHCTDTNQQCHQAMADNGVAFASSAQLMAAASTPADAAPSCLEELPASIARPPDLHALCVNRI
jgi:hypothetical protein